MIRVNQHLTSNLKNGRYVEQKPYLMFYPIMVKDNEIFQAIPDDQMECAYGFSTFEKAATALLNYVDPDGYDHELRDSLLGRHQPYYW